MRFDTRNDKSSKTLLLCLKKKTLILQLFTNGTVNIEWKKSEVEL